MGGFENQVKILYEDNHLLGVYKPAGMLTQGDRTGDPSLLNWAKNWIKVKYMKPGDVFLGLVHRLDRPVAGVVLFARTSKAAGRLSSQIREHQVKKIYWAVVHGHPQPPKGRSEIYITRSGTRSIITGPGDPSGQLAELTYRVLEGRNLHSLLEVTLITGRHHQIRCQLAGLGYPILGDGKYGSPQLLPGRNIGLLAKQLMCRHPTKDTEVLIESPTPEEWPWPPSPQPAGGMCFPS